MHGNWRTFSHISKLTDFLYEPVWLEKVSGSYKKVDEKLYLVGAIKSISSLDFSLRLSLFAFFDAKTTSKKHFQSRQHRFHLTLVIVT